MTRSEHAVSFRPGDPGGRYMCETVVSGQRWSLRLNMLDAAQSLYTLFVDDVEAEPLMQWPAAWVHPASAPGVGIDEGGYWLEMERFARSLRAPRSALVK